MVKYMSSFTLTMENFEGPIDLLLNMIEKRKMPINDISLAAITEEYLSFMGRLNEHDMGNKTHFILVASTLTLIKSKSLLPKLELTEEEECDIEDLKKRLELLKIFQKGSILLKKHIRPLKSFVYARPRKQDIAFEPPETLDINELYVALTDVFKTVPQKESTKKEASLEIVVHIESMMSSLEERIRHHLATDFESFIKDQTDDAAHPRQVRVYQIVGFLAVLELVRKGSLETLQETNFSPIHIQSL